MKQKLLKEFEEFGELYSFPFGLTNSVMGYKFEKDGSVLNPSPEKIR